MNIFVTNSDPQVCALELPDILLRKMIVETSQLLSTAHRVIDGDGYADKVGLYKATHKNHPCALWVRERYENYDWCSRLLKAYVEEYHKRFNKHHKTAFISQSLTISPIKLRQSNPMGFMTQHPLCMPDEFKTDNVYESYQAYLQHKRLTWATRTDKKKIKMTWTNRKEPEWMKGWDDG